MFFMENDTLYLINCDSHNNCDSLDVEMPGNDADGYTLLDGNPESDTSNIAYIYGCRAWNNSDDGFEISNNKQLDIHDCWSWNNGYLEGDPNGFKFNYSHLKSTWKRKVYNCIAAGNTRRGFTDVNLHADMGPFMEYSNNTSYLCGHGFGSSKGQVFDCGRHPASVRYRNNISYAYTGTYPVAFAACDYGYPTYVTQDHNTWVQTGQSFYTDDNPAYSVSANDFLSLDTAQLRWPRKPDGSLPEITFLKPRNNSDLINRGKDAGLAFYGPAPDLGAFQIGPFSVELISPQAGSKFKKGDQIILQARVEGLPEEIEEVIFYTDNKERELGSGEQIATGLWQFSWIAEEPGYQDLRAVAFSSLNETATSSIRRIWIPGKEPEEGDSEEQACKIVPNPNDGFFSLELEEPLEENCDVHVFSLTGQLMAMETIAPYEMTKEMDLSALPPGFYNIRLGIGDGTQPCNGGLKMVLN